VARRPTSPGHVVTSVASRALLARKRAHHRVVAETCILRPECAQTALVNPGGLRFRTKGLTKARKSAEMLRVGGDVWRRLSGVRTAQLHPVPLVRKCRCFWVSPAVGPYFAH
jgi:hypothetical protein